MTSCCRVAWLFAAGICAAQPAVDQVVERTRQAFEVPGIAVAIVKDGKVVLRKATACVSWERRLR